MIKKLSDTMDQNPEFKPNWVSSTDVISANKTLGSINHGVMHDDQGKPLYDSPIWIERTGAIAVPVDQNGDIVMLINHRRVACSPSRLGEIPFHNYFECGIASLELPRGFPDSGEDPADTALREVYEETGYESSDAIFIGSLNPNTTFFPFSHRVFQVSVDTTLVPNEISEKNERIDAVLVLTWQQILDKVVADEIFCGMTKAALLSFFAHKNANP